MDEQIDGWMDRWMGGGMMDGWMDDEQMMAGWMKAIGKPMIWVQMVSC